MLQDRLELAAHVHRASVSALGRVESPIRERAGHADLTAGEVEVGPLEREAFSEAQASARQEQEERVESALPAQRFDGRRRGQEPGELRARHRLDLFVTRGRAGTNFK